MENREGFVYVSERDDGPMKRARQGAIVSVEGRRPPLIVVHHETLEDAVEDWPGRLWQVRIIEAASPLPYPTNYTQAMSVEVLGEASVALLFGAYGKGVVQILEAAQALSRTQADELAASRKPEAAAAYDRTFRRWAKAFGFPVSEHSLDGVLALGFSPPSPVNRCLALLDDVVFERAEFLEGEKATKTDEEGEIWLLRPWSTASRVLRDAALAIGAADFIDRDDQEVLLAGWKRVFGS